MGSLKAIADNQHVKYVIFARYAQNGLERGKKNWSGMNRKFRAQVKNDTNIFFLRFFTFLAFLYILRGGFRFYYISFFTISPLTLGSIFAQNKWLTSQLQAFTYFYPFLQESNRQICH